MPTTLLLWLWLLAAVESAFISVASIQRRSFATYLASYNTEHQYAEEALSYRWYGNSKPPNTNRLVNMKASKKCTLTFRTPDGLTKRFRKKRNESIQHVLVKAIIWSLYSDRYGDIQVEHDIGNSYLPDCIALDPFDNKPIFWGESGRVSVKKGLALAEKHQNVHVVIIRWAINVEDFSAGIRKAYNARRDPSSHRSALFEFGSLPNDVWHYFDKDNTVRICRDDIQWITL